MRTGRLRERFRSVVTDLSFDPLGRIIVAQGCSQINIHLDQAWECLLSCYDYESVPGRNTVGKRRQYDKTSNCSGYDSVNAGNSSHLCTITG